MNTDTMIRNLRGLYEQHKNDHVDTLATNWSSVCWDVANRLEELERKNKELEEKITKIDSIATVSSDSFLSEIATNVIGYKIDPLKEIKKIINK